MREVLRSTASVCLFSSACSSISTLLPLRSTFQHLERLSVCSEKKTTTLKRELDDFCHQLWLFVAAFPATPTVLCISADQPL